MISFDQLNPHLVNAEYAVRGPIVQRAQELEAEGKKIIYCNIGNPQALDQKPLSFIRQILSLLEYPELLDKPEAVKLFPADVVERVRKIFSMYPYGMGAYSQSTGIPFIRHAIAEFIRRRDDIPADHNDILLTDGASKGVSAVLFALQKNENDGFMIPIPQYPLYSATVTLHGGKQVGYYLDEKNQWQLDEKILNESYAKAIGEGIHPVLIAVINPGNPTGAVLSHENIEMVIRFAKKNNLVILADEVYQTNVYHAGSEFHSFAKVMFEMKETGVSLFSTHSVSKGFLGECGHRGGYLEMRNVPDDVKTQFVKLQSVSLCSNLSGQMATYAMVDPPRPGDESYELFIRERDGIIRTLKHKAEILKKGIDKIEGMSMNIPRGAMYAFVRFELPPERGVDISAMSPDERSAYEASRDSDYCLRLLEETGICVVPGSGFGQAPGTLHFRTTFLPRVDEIEELVIKLKQFHESYVKRISESGFGKLKSFSGTKLRQYILTEER